MPSIPAAFDPSRRSLLRAGVLAGSALALPSLHARTVASPITHAPIADSPIAAAVERAIAEQRLVGAVVLVCHEGRQIHRQVAGLTERESGRAMQADALFRLASVSKTVTTTAAMALVARGRLDLDAAVSRWLPRFRPVLADGSRPDISLRQLLAHTSGLGYRFTDTAPGHPYARAGISDGLDRCGFDLAENLRRIASAPLLFAPGTRWNYGLGIDVAGAVIERAADMPLPDAVQQLVGAPLGWRDTGFSARDPRRLGAVYVNDAGTPPHRMHGAEQVALVPGAEGVAFDARRALDLDAWPSAGAGMVGSADELMRLLEALRRGGEGVVPARIAADMARDQLPPTLQSGAGTGFGLGFSVLRDPAAAGSPESPGTWRWGGIYGHNWFVDPARQLSVLALTNTLFEGMSGAFVNDLRDAVYAQIGATTAR